MTNSVIAKPMTYSIKDTLAPDPDVRLLFEGLLWFVFHGTDECQVGIHNTTHVMPHDHRHDLDIKAWTIDSNCGTQNRTCDKLQPNHIGNPKLITGIQIDVNRPSLNGQGIYVFQKDVPSGGGQTVPEDRDWRWVIEFEKEPLYPGGIALSEENIYPSVSINHGRFFTLYRTKSTYRLVPADGTGNRVPVESVALIIGSYIYLDPGGDVTLTIRRKYPLKPLIRRYPKVAGKCYQLDIRNTCINQNGKRCTPNDYGTKQNDFYLYNETFEAPFGEPKYVLERVTQVAAGPLPKDYCFATEDMPIIESSNDAPCGPVSAGGGGGG